ncbi:MAG: hypothetical protein ACXVEE_22375, partial [Polyangiales bacterium]
MSVTICTLVTTIGCDRTPPASTVQPAPPPAPAPVAPTPVPTLVSDEPIVPLRVEGHGDAIVSLPIGTKEKRPIVIAVHGNYDRPEWQCGTWRSILHDRAFVLCPRGIQRPDSPSPIDIRFTFANGVEMAKELDAAIAALRARWPEFVADGPRLYTGFSLGAITGVAWILKDPTRAPVAVLTEGSHAQWTPAAIAAFARGGGKRV